MKKFSTFMAIAAVAILAFAFSVAGEGLKIGDTAPMQKSKMESVDGNKLSLADAKMENGLLVVFSCNTCPFVIAWEDTYPELAKYAKENKVGMVIVNSNEAKREGDDSMEKMQEHYEEAGYKSPYVLDENHKLADAFGAKTTPHVYLFNAQMQLAYEGAIDDKYESREKKASKFYLKDAINSMANGGIINPMKTKATGCSIKRVKA